MYVEIGKGDFLEDRNYLKLSAFSKIKTCKAMIFYISIAFENMQLRIYKDNALYSIVIELIEKKEKEIYKILDKIILENITIKDFLKYQNQIKEKYLEKGKEEIQIELKNTLGIY